MKLYQINEPSEPIETTGESLVVGIDLGTTNSLIAHAIDGKAQILASTPSVVNDVHSIKRLMGKGKNDVMGFDQFEVSSDDQLKVKCGDDYLTAVEISAKILTHLKIAAEKKLNKTIHKVVITVPAYFGEASRQATKDAARIAGLEVLRLINEPTAAAVAYGLDNKAEGTYLIYDLGGGTFDVSILKMQMGVFQVLATNGDSSLGGDDFDKLLMEFIFKKYPHKKLQNENDYNDCLLASRAIKESFKDNVYKGTFPFIETHIEVSQQEFEALITPLLERTIQLVKNCLNDAALEFNKIKEIILVGGSTKLLSVKKLLTSHFKKPVDNVDPDQIVAIGAAIQAEGLAKGSNNLLIDVTPLSLGIEVAEGLVDVVIPRNTPLPFSQKQMFTTQVDAQTAFKIHVLQGESAFAKDCRSIARFELKGIPPMHAKEARLEINFQIDADGLLIVSAQEKISGASQTVEVKPSYGLTEDEILALLNL